MHSSHQSRGRILFDFFCALVIVASCAGAWMQTGASALLGVAAAAGLYGLVRLTDMRWPTPVEAIEPQRIDFTTELPEVAASTLLDDEGPQAPPERSMPIIGIEESAPVEPAASPGKTSRKAKASRKGSGTRNNAAKGAKVTLVALPEEPGIAPSGEEDESDPPAPDELSHPHIEPLFEPDPFLRAPRRAFGRRGQL